MAKLQLAFDILARDRASRTLDQVGNKAERTGKRVSGAFDGAGRKVGRSMLALAGAGGVGALVGSSVKLAASFDQTMRLVAVATDTPAAKLKDLSGLALKMGADTTFSAKQAADAMLELAKGGMKEAEIRGGALSSTLTLAAAGGLELGEAAGYVVQGLSTFNLKAGNAAEVAAALAGGANASTASVQDMGLALSQVGPGAVQAGLTLQDTTAVLAAFAQNGIKGSDAGTSLKTMLTRLIPTTAKAKGKMQDLGLEFTDASGNMKDITEIAQELQDGLHGLSDAQRSAALATIFGSDATRAASILAKTGAAGLAKYVKATSDKTQAERLARAATEGASGAMEQMRGSIETAQIALGTALAPAVVKASRAVASFAGGPLADFFQGMSNGTGAGGRFADVLGDLGDQAKAAWSKAKPVFSFIGDHPKLFAEVAKDAAILAVALKGIGAVKKLPGVGSLLGGGKAGLLGGITKAAPLPVFVTNPGFGAGGPGGKGAPVPVGGVPAGEPGKGGKFGKFGKLLKSPAAGQAVLIADIVLTDKAIRSLKKVYNLKFDVSVNDAAKQFLQQLEAPGTDKATRRILQKHYDAVFTGVAEASRTGNTKVLQDALTATYSELHRNAAAIQTQITREAAVNADKNARLISGGLLKSAGATDKASRSMSLSLSNNIGTGVRAAMSKVDTLGGSLDKLGAKKPAPKVSLVGGDAATRSAQDLFLKLQALGRLHVQPRVGVVITSRDLPLPTGARAGGGPVSRDRPYIVGEREPELFVPNQDGHIYNQRQMAALGGGGMVVHGDFIAQAAPGERAEQSVPRALRDAAFLAGRR